MSESASRRFQPGEGPRRGLLRDYESSDGHFSSSINCSVRMWLRRTGFWVNVILLTCDAESFPEATWEFAYCLRTRYQVSKMGFCPRNKINFVSAAALHKLGSWILSPTCFCCRVEARFLGLGQDCETLAGFDWELNAENTNNDSRVPPEFQTRT